MRYNKNSENQIPYFTSKLHILTSLITQTPGPFFEAAYNKFKIRHHNFLWWDWRISVWKLFEAISQKWCQGMQRYLMLFSIYSIHDPCWVDKEEACHSCRKKESHRESMHEENFGNLHCHQKGIFLMVWPHFNHYSNY